MKVVHFDVNAQANKRLDGVVEAFDGVSYELVTEPDRLAAALPEAEVMIANNRSYTPKNAELIREHGKRLKWIQFSTSGIDKGVSSGFPAGVTVTNAAGLRAFAVGEHAMTLLLSVYRKIRQTEQAREAREWSRDRITPMVETIAGKTAMIVGVGAIGQDIARKLKAFDATVIGISRSTTPIDYFDEIKPRGDLIQSASAADIVVMAATYEPATDKMANAALFEAMKQTGVFINIARGKLVDEVALIDALQRGSIAGAGLDVMEVEPLPPESPLWTADNVVLTPHIGGTGGANPAGGFDAILRDNLARYVAGQPLHKVMIARTE